MDAVDVALASTVSGALVGIAGLGFAYLTSKAERESRAKLASAEFENQRQLARDTRLFEERKVIYAQLSDHVHLTLAYLFAIRPALDRPPKPRPEEIEYEHFRNVRAAVATFGSHELITELDEFHDAVYRYEKRVASAQDSRTDEKVAEAEDAYKDVRARFQKLEQLIRTDLTT